MFNRSDRCPCPPCPSLCVRGVGFRVLSYTAQLGRLGGSRQEVRGEKVGLLLGQGCYRLTRGRTGPSLYREWVACVQVLGFPLE